MSFLLALQFLTAIPVRIQGEITPKLFGRAMAWFPVVGLMIGAILAGVDTIIRIFPPTIGAALVLAVWVMLTGALHLDGFLDCCDGLLAAKPPEKRLEILRDTHAGAFAIVGAICLLLLKYTTILEMPSNVRTAAFLVIPPLTRTAMVYLAHSFPYARSGPGLGQMFREGLNWRHLLIAVGIAIGIAVSILGIRGLFLVGWVGVIATLLAWLVQRRIPGLTGDVYGLVNEIAEVTTLLLLVIWN